MPNPVATFSSIRGGTEGADPKAGCILVSNSMSKFWLCCCYCMMREFSSCILRLSSCILKLSLRSRSCRACNSAICISVLHWLSTIMSLRESRMEAIGSTSFLVVLRPPEDDALGVPTGIRASDGLRTSEVPLNRKAGVVAKVSKAARSGTSSSRFYIRSSSGVSELGLKSGSLRSFSSEVFVNLVSSSDRSTALVPVSVLRLFAGESEYRSLGRVFCLPRAGVLSGFFSFAVTLYPVERKSSASKVSAFLAMSSQRPASASPPSAQTFLQVIYIHRHRRTNQYSRVACIKSSRSDYAHNKIE